MDELDLITARGKLTITINKMRNACDEIKQKQPHKTELISRMDESISDITESYVSFCALESEHRAALQINNSNYLALMVKDAEIAKLKKEIEQYKQYL